MDTKKLRQKILDLAIRGKLVPQDPADEPASVLLERIKAEKEQLIKEGKIKRSKKSSKTTDTPHYENMPFEVPDNWVWCSLEDFAKDITDFVASGSFASLRENVKYYNEPNYAILVRTKDFQSGFDNGLVYTDEHGYEFLQNSRLFGGELILPNIGASIGKAFIVPKLNRRMTLAPNSILLRTINEEQTKWLYTFFTSKIGVDNLFSISSSSAQGKFNKTDLRKVLIPLPPLSEQQRIAYEIERWFALIDKIEQDKTNLQTVIAQTKSKILDLAIHGKLVPQDLADESAIELLKRINPKAEITCDNGHYENLPDEWCCVPIKEAFTINPRNKVDDENIDAGFVPMAMISEGYSNDFIYETRPWCKIKSGFTHFANGDIAVAKISPCLENRKSMILKGLPNGIGAGTTELHVFRSQCVDANFGFYFFKSDYFINQCVGTFNGVVGQQRVSKAIIENINIGIPPLAEQERIANKIHLLFATLDRITEEL